MQCVKHPHCATRWLHASMLSGAVAWNSVCGCAQSARITSKPTAKEGLVDQSSALESQRPQLGTDVWNRKAVISIVRGEARGGYLVEGVDAGELARLYLGSAFQSSPNYVIANRSVVKQVAAERQLQNASRADAPASGTITGADYIVAVTVTQVERSIRADGSSMEWRIVGVGGSTRDRGKQGAVEVMVEVVDVGTTNIVHTARGLGLLDETEHQEGAGMVVVQTEAGSFRRVTVSDAVRAACIQAAQDIDQFFASKHLSNLKHP